MIGIYKITNKLNGHCYIGQSKDINKRWNNHKAASGNPKDASYDYPLYRAFRKYGIDNFTFEILEECQISELNEREKFHILNNSSEYNQTIFVNYEAVPQKLNKNQVKEIQSLLLKGEIAHGELAKKYGVHKDTIRDINVGRTWKDDSLTYPLHVSKFDASRKEKMKKKKYYCLDCGKEISKNAVRCSDCDRKYKKLINMNKLPVAREELKTLIRTQSFTSIGLKYGVSDNAIRKWCINYNLPSKSREIKSYSDKEWENI